MQATSLSIGLRHSVFSVFVYEFRVVSFYYSVHVRVGTVVIDDEIGGDMTVMPAA